MEGKNNNRISITKSELTELRENKGYTIPQIAKHYNLSNEQTRRLLIQAGLPTKSTKRIKFNLINE
jgi:hypothetical protein